jgi:hypothetical protein
MQRLTRYINKIRNSVLLSGILCRLLSFLAAGLWIWRTPEQSRTKRAKSTLQKHNHPQHRILTKHVNPCWVGGSVVGWYIMLEAGRSRVRFLMTSLEFSINLILPAALCPWIRIHPLTEMTTRNLPGGKGWPHRHLWAECLENVAASTSHMPLGLHGLVQGEIYLSCESVYGAQREMH